MEKYLRILLVSCAILVTVGIYYQMPIMTKRRSRPKAATYYLVQSRNMEQLNLSIRLLDKHFNNRFNYPVINFHEDDFTMEYQDQLKAATKSNIFFQLVKFDVPPFIDRPIPETVCKKKIGSRHMCRFHAKGVYEQPIMKHFDYAWRLDDDSFILADINYDVFEFMSDNRIIYGYNNVQRDDAKCTVNLWRNVSAYVKRNKIKTTFFDQWKPNRMFYNNFELSSTKLWMSAEYKAYMDMIDRAGGIYYHRWGDAPIKSIAVSMFVPLNRTHCFSDIAYRHQGFFLDPTKGKEKRRFCITNIAK